MSPTEVLSLVSELAVEVHADGGRVLFGSCYEDVDEPYGPFVQAMVADAGSLGDVVVRRTAGEAGEALTVLAPELARLFPTSDSRPPSGDVEVSERRVLLDAICRWLETSAEFGQTPRAAGRPGTVVDCRHGP